MRALLMPAVVAAVQITSPSHHDADQMRESFYGLAAAKAKNGGKLDEATKTEVQRILTLVDTNLIAALWEDRDAAQKAYNASVQLVNGCNSKLTGTDLPKYVNEKEYTKTAFEGFTDCLDQENVICADKEGNCTALDQFVCGWKDDVCNDGPMDDDECSECKTVDPTKTALYKSAQCLVDFHGKYFTEYIQRNDKCNRLKADLVSKKRECDDLQGDLEDQKCTEQQKITNICNGFDTCWSGATGALDETNTSTHNLENIFQKQYTALQCLLCYGNQILADKTDLTVCENAAPPTFACCDGEARRTEPTVSLAICYYDHETKYDCEAEKDANMPCTEGFHEVYYSAYDNTCANSTCGKTCRLS